MPSTGIFDCMSKTVATEGVHGLYRGFWGKVYFDFEFK